mmetsp:Transcript_53590/g.113816  ORF Transcript_53590/g.113816 Transcript_53590/m.113816 type:complete len:109 (+) Transcript_53590:48-374(+)
MGASTGAASPLGMTNRATSPESTASRNCAHCRPAGALVSSMWTKHRHLQQFLIRLRLPPTATATRHTGASYCRSATAASEQIVAIILYNGKDMRNHPEDNLPKKAEEW